MFFICPKCGSFAPMFGSYCRFCGHDLDTTRDYLSGILEATIVWTVFAAILTIAYFLTGSTMGFSLLITPMTNPWALLLCTFTASVASVLLYRRKAKLIICALLIISGIASAGIFSVVIAMIFSVIVFFDDRLDLLD